MLSPHQEKEAERMKFSEVDHKKCTTDNVEQGRDVFMEAKVAYYLPDEENQSENITTEEFHGKFGVFIRKELR